MKAEAQGTPIPPVQDGDDLQKAQKRKRDRDGNSKDNKTGDGGSEDASTKV